VTASANGTRQGGQPATLAAPPTWREERRLDRLATAQIARDDQAARVQASIAEAEAAARRNDARRQARQARHAAARYRRAARRAAIAAWLRGHVTSLLFVPVITMPGALAWTAMAAYGSSLYGPAGIALPAFSEGAMWAFAAATTITRHRDPDRPVWHLRLGTVVFAAAGAALNFAHGLASGSVITGAVMALVSVAGVTAHQLITAGPRRSRAERAADRDSRSAARRERAIGRAARRRAIAVLDADGSVRLVHRPGAVTPVRRWGRTILKPAASPESPVWLPWPMVLPGSAEPAVQLGDVLAAEAVTAYRDWKSAFPAPSGRLPAALRPATQATPDPGTRVTRAPAAQVAPQADSGHPSGQSSSHPGTGTQVTRKPSRRRAQVTRQGISDDNLKDELRSALKSDPDITVAAAAKKLKRGRDRIRPLLEQVRRERQDA